MIEMNMNDPLYITHSNLDCTFSTQELKVVTSNTKAGKSPGPDNIPNEIVNYEILFPILYKAFHLFYDYGLTPSTWSEAIIVTILKSRTSDPRVPQNCRSVYYHVFLNCMESY